MASSSANPNVPNQFTPPYTCLTCNERLFVNGFGGSVMCKNRCVQPLRCTLCYNCIQTSNSQFQGFGAQSRICTSCKAKYATNMQSFPVSSTPTTVEEPVKPARRRSTRKPSNSKQPQSRPEPILIPDNQPVIPTAPIRFSRELKCSTCDYSWLMNIDATVAKAVKNPNYIDSVLKCNDCFQMHIEHNQKPTAIACCVCNKSSNRYELNPLAVRLWATSSYPLALSVSCADCVQSAHNASSTSSTYTPPMLMRTFSQNPGDIPNRVRSSPTSISTFNLPSVFLKNTPAGTPGSDDDALIKLIMNKVFGIDKIAVYDPPCNSCPGETEDDDTCGPATKSNAMDTTPDERANWPFEWIGDINTISDLIRLGKAYKPETRVVTNLDTAKLVRLVAPLERLDSMVGLADVKASIFHQIIFHLQGLDEGMRDMHHTVIKGPPGVGKTEIAHRLAEIYNALGILKSSKVVSVKRDDLIAGYVGQTALKTKKKLEEALGGVLLIDEAYSLGDGSDKDTFSKEAVDLLTSYLSEHGTEFICVIAGYQEALEKRFFSINEGLARRFTIHYEIKPYDGPELQAIFTKTVADGGWFLANPEAAPASFFTEHKDDFPSFGGDMLNLFAGVKKAHSRRLLSIRTKSELDTSRRQITNDDLLAGFKSFQDCNGYKKKEDEMSATAMHIYS